MIKKNIHMPYPYRRPHSMHYTSKNIRTMKGQLIGVIYSSSLGLILPKSRKIRLEYMHSSVFKYKVICIENQEGLCIW
jgi:hypothetical protein